MNAEGLLRKQGWRGAGFSLDTSDRGIKKPLLISHKQDQLGLGKKKASHTTDDQWWMRAFDESLQNLGSGKTSTLTQIQEKGINRGGLYGFFVKGEGLKGSIGDESSAPTSGTSTPPTAAEDDSTDQSSESESDSDDSSSDDAASKKSQKKRKREADESAPATKKLKQEGGALKMSAPAGTTTKGEVRTPMGPISAEEWPKLCAVTSKIQKQAKARVKIHKEFDAKLGKKAAKVTDEKAKRATKQQIVKELIVEAIVKGELSMLNSKKWSKKDMLQNYSKIEKSIKAVKKADKASNKSTRHTETRGAVANTKALSKSESKRKSTVEKHLAELSASKRADYAARAAEKGQTLEEYALRRIDKKKEAKREKKGSSSGGEEAPAVEIEGEGDSAAQKKAQKKSQKKSKTEEKDKSAKSAGKSKTKDKKASKSTDSDQAFMEKAARFGAIAAPIAATA